MKKIYIIRKILAVVLAVLCMVLTLAACGSEVKEPTDPSAKYPKLLGEVKSRDTYTENELYIWNSITERKVYCREVIPSVYNGSNKLPIIVYVHGFSSGSLAILPLPEKLASEGIAGFSFECCGGTVSNPLSDAKGLFPSDYSSRATDLESVLDYVKTLDYVDTDRIYIYGISYGGAVSMSSAPRHNNDIAGLILESTGISEDGGMFFGSATNGKIDKYCVPDDWKSYLKSYNGNVLMIHTELDKDVDLSIAEYTATLYKQRDSGSVKFCLCPEGEHTFNSFSEEGKKLALASIKEFVLGE